MGKSMGNCARSSRASGAYGRDAVAAGILLRDITLVMTGTSSRQRFLDLGHNGPGQLLIGNLLQPHHLQWARRWFD